MKRKYLVLLAMAVMAVLLLSSCASKKMDTNEVKTENGFQYVSPEAALEAAKDGKSHILDVRAWENYSTGRVANSEWSPIFPLEDTTLEASMQEYAKANLQDGEKIYIVCNSGKRGAEKTTEILKGLGIDEKLIFTVEGGAKALSDIKGALSTNRTDEAIDWKYIKGSEVLAMEGAQIVDVRDADTYAQGHLAASQNLPLKEIESAEAQTAMYNLAQSGLDKSKPVYFLCYSGNKCAKTAISVMLDAGHKTENLFIIENGAKDEAISGAFVK